MGGVGLIIELAVAPADPAALHREVWDILADGLAHHADLQVTAQIVTQYLYMQSVDGFADGDWCADGSELSYWFRDASGLCMVEMYACLHWTSMLVLAQWPALTAAAARHGATLTPPDPDPEAALRAMLTGRSDEVFFNHFTDEDHEHLGYAEATDDPAGDHELRFATTDPATLPLSATGEDRERLTHLITTGRCACEVCQLLRLRRGLPLARDEFQ